MQYLAFLGFLALYGCGSSSPGHTPVVQVAPELQPILDQFKADGASQGKSIVITDLVAEFVPSLPGETMGQCITDSENLTSPTIQISQEDWDVLDTDGQKELFYHELGHCVLGRVHRWNENNGIPLSLMSPAFLGSTIFDSNKGQYLYELFTETDDSSFLPLHVPPNTMIPDLTSPTDE